MATNSLISGLRQLIKKHGVYGYIIPNNDEFQSEYLPESAKRLEFITKFTGSAGTAIITPEENLFFTDGRYMLQAKKELGKNYTIKNVSRETIFDWIKTTGKKVGFDPMHFTVRQVERMGDLAKPISENLVDKLWGSKPPAPNSKPTQHKFAGKTSGEKIKEIAGGLKSDICLITTPDSVNWLFNVRGEDVLHTPLLLSYATLTKKGEAKLCRTAKELAEVTKFKKKNIQLDPNKCPYAIYAALKAGGNNISFVADPCQLPKAIKTSSEIKGVRKAHDIDGKALTKFLVWVKSAKNLDEIKAAEKLGAIRSLHKDYRGPSFTTISGFGSNGAIVHYNVSRETNKKFTTGNLYLIDSGGQYEYGTTDVTRTIAIGKPTKDMIHDYTLVLKGHIAIATAKFPAGTSGAQIDGLARQFLWAEGKDYDHGTGHGVGYYLGVHEGPHGISRRYSDVALQPGMIVSNEPGYYKEGHYGIRIENLVLVVDLGGGYLGFETLTKAPLDENLIDFSMLTKQEKDWIKAYHETVLRNLQK